MSTRDQSRALHAYACVEAIAKQDDAKLKAKYKVLVNGLGAHILRSGLAATVAFIEREKKERAVRLLLAHLAGANIPGLVPTVSTDARPPGASAGVPPAEGTGDGLPGQVRGLKRDAYILATRELLRVVLWFRRAVQATLGGVKEEQP